MKEKDLEKISGGLEETYTVTVGNYKYYNPLKYEDLIVGNIYYLVNQNKSEAHEGTFIKVENVVTSCGHDEGIFIMEDNRKIGYSTKDYIPYEKKELKFKK